MKPKSKLLSLLLAICLVVGLMPTAAFAAEGDTGKAIQLVDSGTAANISGAQADNIYFGTYQQSSDGSGGYNTNPVKWRVLSNASEQLLLLSDQNLDVFQYHTEYESVTWEKSTMRSWLNGYGAAQNTGSDNGIDYTSDNFINTAFSDGEQGAIVDTTVVTRTITQRAARTPTIKSFFCRLTRQGTAAILPMTTVAREPIQPMWQTVVKSMAICSVSAKPATGGCAPPATMVSSRRLCMATAAWIAAAVL